MPAIQIRNLDVDTYELLKREAKASGRSLNKQLESIVKEHFSSLHTQTPKQEEAVNASAEPAKTQPAKTVATLEHPLQQTAVATDIVSQQSLLSSTNEQRQRKRECLFERIAHRSYPEFPAGLEPATLIREMRDAR